VSDDIRRRPEPEVIVDEPFAVSFLTSSASNAGHGVWRLRLGLIRASLLLAVLTVAMHSVMWASDLVLITTPASDAVIGNEVRSAARFYGLEVRGISISGDHDSVTIARLLKESSGMGVIASADVLRGLKRAVIFKALRRLDGSQTPLLIVTTGAWGDSSDMSKWSGGLVEGCRPVRDDVGEWSVSFSSEKSIVHELADLSLKAATGPTCGLVLSSGRSVQILASIHKGADSFAAYAKLNIDGQPVFILSAMRPVGKRAADGPIQLQNTLSNLAGFMIFMRNAAGERAWHVPTPYANLTIDDPWLTEPYGNLEYHALLREMEAHNFHTTIAFVPWNFDRSRPNVVSLFRDHPERFSICVHGNNHNHQEFGDYDTQPLDRQGNNIQQAIARMDRFSRTTGLPYDRIMIFPHSVAPAETFGLLKRNNYWATVNSQSVPLGSSLPDDQLFALRTWTLSFKGFTSVSRISADVPVSATRIAINAFLGNPQLYYVHQEVFEDQIGAFNTTADEINRLVPNVRWASLGEISKHLYQIRLRPDHDYDVLAASSHMQLVNPTTLAAVFHVRRREDLSIPPRVISVDGRAIPFQSAPAEISFDVQLKPQERKDIEISYSDDLRLTSVDISKRDPLITADRWLSDFRDIYLSRSPAGRRIQLVYYKYGMDKIEKVIERFLVIIVAFCVFCLLLRISINRARRSQARALAALGMDTVSSKG
jgi:hypothetical protein